MGMRVYEEKPIRDLAHHWAPRKTSARKEHMPAAESQTNLYGTGVKLYPENSGLLPPRFDGSICHGSRVLPPAHKTPLRTQRFGAFVIGTRC